MWHMAVFERVVWKWHFQTLPPLGWLTAVVFALCSSAAIWVRCSIQPSLPLVLLCRFGVSVSQKLCSTIHTAVWMRRSWANSPHPSQYESLGGSEGWNFTPGDDTPLELVSRGHYWRTELVWTDKPAVCIKGVSIRQSDNCTGPSLNLIKRNVPQSNVTEPNNSNVVTVTVFGNLGEEKKIHRYTWRSVCPPACPTDSSSHFCPKNSVSHPQKTFAHQVPPSHKWVRQLQVHWWQLCNYVI